MVLARVVFRLLALLGLVLFAGINLSARASTQLQAMSGNIESVKYNAKDQTIKINGWAWDSRSKSAPSQLSVTIKNQHIEIDSLTPVSRTDVQQYLGIDSADIGFSTTFKLNQALSGGTFPLEIVAKFSDGYTYPIASNFGATPFVFVELPRDRHWILLALVITFIAIAYVGVVKRYAERIGNWVQLHPGRVSACIGSIFFLLVACGITGSSWQLLTQGPESQFADFQGSKKHLFKPQQIRADEWSILTTNSLAQWNHHPRFPIINSNLGLEGQNMGIIGMTGVPIAQPAALARPATWGYFVFPLRQAMAWHWQFAFFACLFVLWKALNLLSPRSAGFNLLLAFTYCVAPYAVGWSLWPLYASFFPLALLVLGAAALETHRLSKSLPIGVAMGLLLAGWVLVLYPPWQITIGTFIGFLTAGWIADRKGHLEFGKAQIWAFALAILVAGLLLSSWWLDTADAVGKVQATVYPGARTLQQGGDLDLFWALRGYSNTENLTFGTGPYINESEVSAYILLPLPLLLLGLWFSRQHTYLRWTLRAIMAFLAFWLVFRFAGIPLWLAKATFWSFVTSTRLDLVLGLTCTVLLALIYKLGNSRALGQVRPVQNTLFALGVSIASAALVVLAFKIFPPGTIRTNSLVLQAALTLAVAVGAWWMMRGKIRAAACLMLLLSLIATLGFNPLSIAPRTLNLAPSTAKMVTDEALSPTPLRTLVISNSTKAAMTLASAGVPVVNGVLYYPHRSLWEKMTLEPDSWPEVNRYQHLNFILGDLPTGPPFKVHHPSLDVVTVTVDPKRFQFASTGATRVVAQGEAAHYLRQNTELTLLGNDSSWFWFAVKHSSPQPPHP